MMVQSRLARRRALQFCLTCNRTDYMVRIYSDKPSQACCVKCAQPLTPDPVLGAHYENQYGASVRGYAPRNATRPHFITTKRAKVVRISRAKVIEPPKGMTFITFTPAGFKPATDTTVARGK